MKQQRQAYIAAGRKKMGQMSELLQEYVLMPRPEVVEEFRRFFHSVKGTAQTFRLMELGSVGMRYDHLLRELPADGQTQKAAAIIKAGLEEFSRELEKCEAEFPMDSGTEESPCSARERSASKGCILAMDDDQTLLELIRIVLCKEGYDTRVTVDLEKAVEILEQLKPDLFLVDYHMAGLSGMDVLVRIRDRGIPAPVVILTGDSSEALRQKLLDGGALGLISKPFKPPQLINEVNSYLGMINP